VATAAAVLLASLVVGHTPDLADKQTHQHAKLLRRFEPFRGWTQFDGSSRYAIPATIVECESHGMVHEDSHPDSSSGLYQIELSSWNEFGGRAFASFPFEATKLAQSIVATRIWRSVGARAWTCSWIVGWL
jgi:hypothetical protein